MIILGIGNNWRERQKYLILHIFQLTPIIIVFVIFVEQFLKLEKLHFSNCKTKLLSAKKKSAAISYCDLCIIRLLFNLITHQTIKYEILSLLYLTFAGCSVLSIKRVFFITIFIFTLCRYMSLKTLLVLLFFFFLFLRLKWANALMRSVRTDHTDNCSGSVRSVRSCADLCGQ